MLHWHSSMQTLFFNVQSLFVLFSDEKEPMLAEYLNDTIDRIRDNDPTFTRLILSYHDVDSMDAKHVAEVLRHNHHVSELLLFFNNIADTLAAALAHNSSLRTINLAYNNIGVKGATALADALKRNPSVTSLSLHKNNVGVEGVRAIAEAIDKHNTRLVALDISKCGLEETLDKGRSIVDSINLSLRRNMTFPSYWSDTTLRLCLSPKLQCTLLGRYLPAELVITILQGVCDPGFVLRSYAFTRIIREILKLESTCPSYSQQVRHLVDVLCTDPLHLNMTNATKAFLAAMTNDE